MFELHVLVDLDSMRNETEEKLCVLTGVVKSPGKIWLTASSNTFLLLR